MLGQRTVYALSGAVCFVVAFLILGPRPEGLAGSVDVSGLPPVNASLNAISATLLISGWVAIKTGRRSLHRGLMVTAFGTSTLFLVSYVIYHWFKAGPVAYEGPFRPAYLVILLTHILLAVVILPMALTTLSFAVNAQFVQHRRLAPITLAVWLYVSVTGVLIYILVHG